MSPSEVTLRHILKPGDIGAIVSMHGKTYACEYGFDVTFEAYVAGPLAEFVLKRGSRDRLWIAERGQQIIGCIAIVGVSEAQAQLRWYLVDASARGCGLGKHLLHEAIAFAKSADYEAIFLWTVSALTVAARLYCDAGFVRVEEKPSKQWGVEVVEEKYVLRLT